MDVSFSANQWKVNEIQNIDLKLQQEFYASTPYNLNDFKDTSRPPSPIFKSIETSLLAENHCVKKQLLKNQNVSLTIFLTFLHEFLNRVIHQIQKKSINHQSNNKLPLLSHLNDQKSKMDEDQSKQTDRKLIEPQKSKKHQQFEVLKTLKLKIYQIDLCRLKNIPSKFSKYYNNNLLKKIIFQYLSKALYNISLVQILLENNQLLCFALSLVSQSLLCKKQIISEFDQNRSFHDQIFTFLQHFDSVDLPQASVIKSTTVLPSSLLIYESPSVNKKIKSSQNLSKVERFANFSLNQKQMKSKHASLMKQKTPEGGCKYFLYLLTQKPSSSTKLSSQSSSQIQSPNKVTKKVGSETSKKSLPSKKYLPPGSDQKLKRPNKQPSWFKYLGCLKYFFMDSAKK